MKQLICFRAQDCSCRVFDALQHVHSVMAQSLCHLCGDALTARLNLRVEYVAHSLTHWERLGARARGAQHAHAHAQVALSASREAIYAGSGERRKLEERLLKRMKQVRQQLS